jgi:hypothetical protein
MHRLRSRGRNTPLNGAKDAKRGFLNILKQGKTLSYRPRMKADLRDAIDAALAGDWHRAHEIVQQDEDDPLACWIHALLHKIEGDAGNSRYWYARTVHSYGEFTDPKQELAAIKHEVESGC